MVVPDIAYVAVYEKGRVRAIKGAKSVMQLVNLLRNEKHGRTSYEIFVANIAPELAE